MAPTLTSRIAQFVCSASDDALSSVVRQCAVRAILDTLAVTVAGGVETPVRVLERALEPARDGRSCRSPWSGTNFRAEDAALLYGMAAHLLDYDDVCLLGASHPSAPILAALLAAGGAGLSPHPPSGREFRLAFCVGTEVMVRIGQAMGFRPYILGFHTTATLGTVGAAAAVAKLLGLDHRRTMHALAIAASMAGGLRKNFGSMVKPLHVGLAASNGLRAVRMAVAGIEGSPEPLESDAFLKAFSGGMTDAWPSGIEFGKPFMLEDPGFGQKRYPCCYMMHRIIEATLAIRRESDCTLGQVKSALVRMPQGGTQPLIHPHPRSGLNAKFSAPYAVVASILDGRIDLKSFFDEAVARPEIQSRLADVVVVEDNVAPVHASDIDGPVSVTLSLHDGSTLSRTVEQGPGSASDPIPFEGQRAKWIDCFGYGLPRVAESTVCKIFDQGCRLEAMTDVSGWLSSIFDA